MATVSLSPITSPGPDWTVIPGMARHSIKGTSQKLCHGREGMYVWVILDTMLGKSGCPFPDV